MDISTARWTAAGRDLHAVAGSVVGRRYSDNFDVLHLDPHRPLAVVADGMGDGDGSRAAGRTAVDVFVRHAVTRPAALRAAMAEVQDAVIAAGRRLPGQLTGCTLTAFTADPASEDGAWLVQLGDSRAYRLRAGLFELLTTDHTHAWPGLLHGWFAHGSPQAQAARYRLTRYAGHPGAPEPDLLNVSLRPGDRYLLCTDGVADQVSFERLGRLLAERPEPARTVAALLEESLVTGEDNATAVLVTVG